MMRKVIGIGGILAGIGVFLFGLVGAAVRWAVWNARDVPGTRASMVSTRDHIIWAFIVFAIMAAGVAVGALGGKILRGAANQAPEDTARKLADPQR